MITFTIFSPLFFFIFYYYFLLGFCAGVFGAAINTPGDTVRTVVQKRVLGGLPGTVYKPHHTHTISHCHSIVYVQHIEKKATHTQGNSLSYTLSICFVSSTHTHFLSLSRFLSLSLSLSLSVSLSHTHRHCPIPCCWSGDH